MTRLTLPAALALGLCMSAATLHGEDRATDLKQVQALQQLVQQLIDEAEPAVACVLVSRSDAYERLGIGPAAASPGKLGAFDPAAFEKVSAVQAQSPKE